ncbi:unnamed protein product [Caenorhabditis bovis]|uniref:G-protein coupled receptors family 1 profile domain-containing protein n=1 Tax=Caenorhabditis bovis TaxID=2654633 RepID=A0A8S1EJL9_9PELO|nr:unnamed protein product [Caenorhabditis bovis]
MAVGSVLLALVMLVLSIVTVVGNLAVLLSYYLDKNIRQPTNYFIFSLAISDLIIGIEGIPVYTAFYLNNNEWIWGDILCDLWLSIDYIVCLASIYTVLGITVDRYYSVPSILFSVSIFGYGTFTGTGRILKETECYVQFMTNPYLNMGMYISYYWTTLFVMLYLYWGIYRAAKKLALKSDQKTKRLALLTELRRPEVSVRTSDAANSSTDSPNDTSNSSKCCRQAVPPPPPTTTIQTSVGCSSPPPPVVRNHMTIHNNNIDHTRNMVNLYSNPTYTPLDNDEEDGVNSNNNNSNSGFYHQEPSSVIERESTAPCCSPEPSSHASAENDENAHAHFKPQFSLPFIDADSVSSMVGHDDLLRAMSSRKKRKREAPQKLAEPTNGAVPEQKRAIGEDEQQASTSRLEMDTVEAISNDCNEVKVPLIAVSRVESLKTTTTGKVRRLLTVMRSRSVRSKRKRNKKRKKEYKSRSENRARKALRTITFILGSFIILWTPFYVLATIYGFCESCKVSPWFNMLYTISYYLCYMNSPLNPFCYAMANQQFKKTLTRIFKGDFRRV